MGPPADCAADDARQAGGEPIRAVGLIDRQSAVRAARPAADDDRFARARSSARSGTRCFPQRTNVEFAAVESPDRVRIRIWERGVGPTESSGTGRARRRSRPSPIGGAARSVEVIAPGGAQQVDWTDDGVFLTGWAEVVWEGTWVAEL